MERDCVDMSKELGVLGLSKGNERWVVDAAHGQPLMKEIYAGRRVKESEIYERKRSTYVIVSAGTRLFVFGGPT